jgi:prepilin peptidase CpaA
MITQFDPSAFALLAILAIAVVNDCRTRRIPNKLIIAGLALGTLCSLVDNGLAGGLKSILGAALALAIFFPMFALRLLGAGDVKLMTVVGSFTGASALLSITLYTFILGGVLAIAVIVYTAQARKVWDNLRLYLTNLTMRRYGDTGALPPMATATASRLPYALAIAGGTLFWLISNSSGHWV